MTTRLDNSTPAAEAAGRRLGRALAAASDYFSPQGYGLLQREALVAARKAGQLSAANILSLQGIMMVAEYIESATRRAKRAEGVVSSKRPVPYC